MPLLDTAQADLDSARRVTFVLRQRFHYAYDGPVRDLDHRLVVIPRNQHGSARRRLYSLDVSTPHARTTVGRNRLGNVSARIRIPDIASSVCFEVAAVVERVGSVVDAQVPKAALTDRRLLASTRRTAPDDAIRTAAHAHASRDPLATAERLCAYVHGAISYQFGATSVSTTAAQALAGGRGVCQDSAHVMLSMCRVLGIPARYVSGHLMGEGGTHAWTEVIVADGDRARAVAFDPCNGRRAGSSYLTVAVGRDYGDVAPTSGTYEGSAGGRLTATKRVGIAAIEPG
jgi:transglutaminase-like putative cysteine protease